MQLPITFMAVRPMSISVSMPRSISTAAAGIWKLLATAIRITSVARGTPAMPLLVSMSVARSTICCMTERCRPAAWAANNAAMER